MVRELGRGSTYMIPPWAPAARRMGISSHLSQQPAAKRRTSALRERFAAAVDRPESA